MGPDDDLAPQVGPILAALQFLHLLVTTDADASDIWAALHPKIRQVMATHWESGPERSLSLQDHTYRLYRSVFRFSWEALTETTLQTVSDPEIAILDAEWVTILFPSEEGLREQRVLMVLLEHEWLVGSFRGGDDELELYA